MNSSHRTLQWRHNGCDGVSNHQPHHCLLNRLFRRRSKKKIKAPRHWPLWGEFTDNRWIPRTNGQLRGIYFHLMTSSWTTRINHIHTLLVLKLVTLPIFEKCKCIIVPYQISAGGTCFSPLPDDRFRYRLGKRETHTRLVVNYQSKLILWKMAESTKCNWVLRHDIRNNMDNFGDVTFNHLGTSFLHPCSKVIGFIFQTKETDNYTLYINFKFYYEVFCYIYHRFVKIS